MVFKASFFIRVSLRVPFPNEAWNTKEILGLTPENPRISLKVQAILTKVYHSNL